MLKLTQVSVTYMMYVFWKTDQEYKINVYAENLKENFKRKQEIF